VVAALDGVREPLLHFRPVVAVKTVTLDEARRDVLAAEDLLEGAHD
jgi:hypothetical protein